MKQKELKRVLDSHKLWLESYGEKGIRANLEGACLKYADLRNTNLERVRLHHVHLEYANLTGANLDGANLEGAHLECANLEGAYLKAAYLRNANLKGANLSNTVLTGANLRGANLENTVLPPSLDNLPEGELIGYKKIWLDNTDQPFQALRTYIVKLQILADSKRSRATGDKCRCDKALVLAIQNIDGTDSGLERIVNLNYKLTTYKVGEMVFADSWDEDRWNECSHGIHFFLDRDLAVKW